MPYMLKKVMTLEFYIFNLTQSKNIGKLINATGFSASMLSYFMNFVILCATMFGKPNSADSENNLDYIICNFLQQITQLGKAFNNFLFFLVFEYHFSGTAEPLRNIIEEK
jgi:hypothetical protein